ncbi:hypothetical protein CYMTET_12554 [Cymbomonas tetramitiformis]|uniref:Uncharacterized protein n=1 Tax=Cymbomonas tetramitiformis TaxID=36881 RepID=A0AAE0GK97_9CHLO|nr:hypothetical protein CYMTET_12554 [Cymbomonas tetramitiformis]
MGKLADKEKYRQYKRKYALLNASDSESGGSEDTDEEEEEEEEEDPGAESKKGSGLDRFALAMAKNGDVPTEEDRKAILRDLIDAKEEEEEEEEEEARGKGKAEPKGKEKAEPKGKEKAGPKGKEAMAGKGKEPMAPKRQGLKVLPGLLTLSVIHSGTPYSSKAQQHQHGRHEAISVRCSIPR